MKTKNYYRIGTVGEYNSRVLTPGDILTGREFRRLKRAGKLNLLLLS
jgi:hypothetical protein